MANPNSVLTRARFVLAQWLDPYPDRGEAWCMGCELNGGRTVVLNANGHTAHAEQHREASAGTSAPSSIAMRINWGHVPAEEP